MTSPTVSPPSPAPAAASAAAATELPAIETRNLTKVYPGFFRDQSVTALENLNLTVNRGEIFGLLGPNGSGKTTTIKLLLGLINPTEGFSTVLGKPTGDQVTRRSIGYLPEETYLYRFLNARQTLDFYARIFNMNRAQRMRAVEYYLDFVGLDPAVRRRRLKTYSKGQARRVGLAQALINDPDLVILDEPTSGLDPLGTQEMKNLIKELKRAGKTVLLSSHQLADVEDVCDRVCILYRGKLEVEGTVNSLLEVQDVFKVEARNVPAEVQEKVVSLLQHSAGVSEVQPGVQRSRLQDLFNRLVLNKRAAERAGK
ncbi:MAG TPA: ABC transporter ATP-binding protein [Phycisphaerae bacterium]|jgi:ABC-2 type transport system ATP-binding protein|nr:ABC transporter ATP-binding protein [Phycisphaerae bacterium]